MIDPATFKKRYVDHFNNDPINVAIPGFIEEMSRFCVYDRETLAYYGVTGANLDFLTSVGLPVSAAPFMHFKIYGIDEIDGLRDYMSLPENFFPIGSNGGGDIVVIDVASDAVMLFLHDEIAPAQIVNSSVPQLAESLCLMQEYFEMTTPEAFLAAIAAIDPSTAREGAMWREEGINIATLNSLP